MVDEMQHERSSELKHEKSMAETVLASDEEMAIIHARASSALKTPLPVVMTFLWASLGGYCMGYNNSIIASSLGQPNFSIYFDMASRSNANALFGLTGAMFSVGGFFGLALQAYVSDKYGRKKGLLIAAIILIVGIAITGGSASSIGMFIFGRWLTGFGGWGCALGTLVYESELSLTETRGFLAGVAGLSYAIGFAFAGWMGVAFFFSSSPSNWRVPLLIGLIFPLAMIAGLPLIPESPRWLAWRGRHAEMEQVMRMIHKSPIDPDHIYARVEAKQIRKQAELENTLDSSWGTIFRKPSYRKRALLSMLVASAMQLSGIQAITSFGPRLYAGLGYGAKDQLLFAAGWITISPIESVVMMFLCDRVGRVKLIAAGAINSAIILAIYSALVAVYGDSDNQAGKAAAVAMIFVFIVAYLFNEVATYVYISEIWPTHIRSKGVAIGLMAAQVMASWVVGATPSGIAALGWRFSLIYVACALVAGVLVLLTCPETKKIPLEGVARLFGDADELADINAIVHEQELITGHRVKA